MVKIVPVKTRVGQYVAKHQSRVAKKIDAVLTKAKKKVIQSVVESYAKRLEKGGAGSGNFGHAGRPGEVGGSAASSASDASIGTLYRGLEVDAEMTKEQFYAIKNKTISAEELLSLLDTEEVGNHWALDTRVPDYAFNDEGIELAQEYAVTGYAPLSPWGEAAEDAYAEGEKTEYVSVPVILVADAPRGWNPEVDGRFAWDGGIDPERWNDIELKAIQYHNGDGKWVELPIKRTVHIEKPVAKRMQKGGAGSGNFDHAGRPGEVGGSAPSGDKTQSEAFKRWFKDSKVVDKDGKPLVVYHGTAQSFNSFNQEKGELTPNAAAEGAFFFATTSELASAFAAQAGADDPGSDTGIDGGLFDPEPGDPDYREPGGSPNVMPVYLSIQNPKIIEARQVMSERNDMLVNSPKLMREMVARAKAEGYDGLKILRYPEHIDGKYFVEDQWAAFSPQQIKSAIGNRGTYDPKKKNITKTDISKHLLAKVSDSEIINRIIADLDLEGIGIDIFDEITDDLVAAYKAAAKHGLAQVNFDSTESIVNHLDVAALAYAEARAGELIKDLAGTTIEDLRGTVGKAVEEGWSSDKLSDSIEELGAFGESRANMIARTELAFAHVEGNVQGWRETGIVEGKKSILGDFHAIDDECDRCAEAGVVAIDEPFFEDLDFPPYHPNCVCDVVPVLSLSDDSDSEDQQS